MMMHRPIIALALLCLVAVAPAAAQIPPYDYPATIGTSPTQILPVNNLRKRLIFYNPNPTAFIAFCPIGPYRNDASITCAVNGAGSITLLPYGSFIIDAGTPSGPQLAMPQGWYGVANTASSAFTVLEFE